MRRTDDCVGSPLSGRFTDNREHLPQPGFNEGQAFFLLRCRYSAEHFRGGTSVDQLRRRVFLPRESAVKNLQIKKLMVDFITDVKLLFDIVKQLSCPVEGI